MTFVFKFLSLLPLWLLHSLGWVLGWAAFLASGVYRKRFLDNVRQAQVPAAGWRPAVGEAGKLVMELPRLWLGRPVPVQWRGQAHMEGALASGKGLILLSPHLGSFEVGGQSYGELFGQTGHPMTALFRPPRQAWLRDVMVASRTRPGLMMAPTTLAGVRQLIKALKRGQTIALLPDQVPPDGQGVWVPFFSRDAYTMTLSARLALQSGAVVLTAWGERLSWGRGFVVHIAPLGLELSGDVDQATAQINRAMEALIAAAPAQYLWGYARYKRPRDAE
jgi:Kdo2-lipid IVA lauroyltransferase/acyltransferase